MSVNLAGRTACSWAAGGGLFGEQVLAWPVTVAWSFVVTYLLCRILDAFLPGGMRASEDDEETGLDLTQHSEVAYAGDRI